MNFYKLNWNKNTFIKVPNGCICMYIAKYYLNEFMNKLVTVETGFKVKTSF